MTDPRSDGGAAVAGPSLGGTDPEKTGTDPAGETETNADAAESARERPALAARQVVSIAGTEVRLGLRRRWSAVLVGLFAAFGLLVLTFAGSAPGPAGFERVVASLATLCVYVVPLAALAYGYDAVVGPAEGGWLEVLSAMPTTGTRILAGTALGRGLTLAGSVLLGFAVPGAILASEYGLASWPATAAVLLAATGLGLAFLSVAVLLSTLVREKTHALGAALLAWVWFVLVHDLLALGVVAAFDPPDATVTAMVLANPASVYRVLVLGLLGAGGAGGFGSVLGSTGVSPGALTVGLGVWTVAPLVAAAAVVRRRGTVAAT